MTHSPENNKFIDELITLGVNVSALDDDFWTMQRLIHKTRLELPERFNRAQTL